MRKVLFDRRSPCLQPVLDAICRHNHRTLVLWALEYAQELTCRFEERYAQETRPRAALEAARAWSRGAIKMPQAQQAILAAHRAAAELEDDRVYCALAHAVGQAVSTVHVETHAIGGPMYALTALALTGGQEAVQAECTHICERLAFWENADTGGQPWAAFLLREKPNKEQLLRDREREQ